MKQTLYKLLVMLAIGGNIFLSSCEKEKQVEYTARVTIDFESEENVITLPEGTTEFDLKGTVRVQDAQLAGLKRIEYGKTTNGNLDWGDINWKKKYTDSLQVNLTEGKREFSFEKKFTDIRQYTVIRVNVVDMKDKFHERNFVIKVVEKVDMQFDRRLSASDKSAVGTFYNIDNGKSYTFLRAHEANLADKIDITLGVKHFERIVGTDTIRKDSIMLISPSARKEMGLSEINSNATKFDIAPISEKAFNDSIEIIDGSLLEKVTATQDFIYVERGKIYSFITSDGRKGMIKVFDFTDEGLKNGQIRFDIKTLKNR